MGFLQRCPANVLRNLVMVGLVLMLGGLAHLNLQLWVEREVLRSDAQSVNSARIALDRRVEDATRLVVKNQEKIMADNQKTHLMLENLARQISRMEADLGRIERKP